MAFQRKVAIGVKAPYPGFIEAALATYIEKVPGGERWVHEIKFHGYRVQVHVAHVGAFSVDDRGAMPDAEACRHRGGPFTEQATNKLLKGSSWNRVGKFEGLKGRKARYFRDLLHFCRVQNLAQMLDGKNIETSSAALGYVFI